MNGAGRYESRCLPLQCAANSGSRLICAQSAILISSERRSFEAGATRMPTNFESRGTHMSPIRIVSRHSSRRTVCLLFHEVPDKLGRCVMQPVSHSFVRTCCRAMTDSNAFWWLQKRRWQAIQFRETTPQQSIGHSSMRATRRGNEGLDSNRSNRALSNTVVGTLRHQGTGSSSAAQQRNMEGCATAEVQQRRIHTIDLPSSRDDGIIALHTL